MFDGGSDLEDVDLRDAGTAAEFAAPHQRARESKARGVDSRRSLGRAPLDAGRASDAGVDRRGDEFFAGVRGPLRRPDGACQRHGARPRGNHRTNPGSARRRHRARRQRGFYRRPAGRRHGDRRTDDSGRHTRSSGSARRGARSSRRSRWVSPASRISAPAGRTSAPHADLANRGELTVRVHATLPESDWARSSQARCAPGVRIAVAAHRRSARIGRFRPHTGRDAHAADGGRPRRPPGVDQPDRGRPGIDGVRPSRRHRARQRRTRSKIPSRERAHRAGGRRSSRLAECGGLAARPASAMAPARALIDKGACVALGSGWPSAPLNPILALDALVARGVATDAGTVRVYHRIGRRRVPGRREGRLSPAAGSRI